MKTILTAIAIVSLAFLAVPVSATMSCDGSLYGQAVPVGLDACHGDSGSDFYAACDGDWQDLYEPNTGTYYQSCQGADGSVNVYVCPASYSYSWQSSACQAVNA